jgi:hypothetical protein
MGLMGLLCEAKRQTEGANACRRVDFVSGPCIFVTYR